MWVQLIIPSTQTSTPIVQCFAMCPSDYSPPWFKPPLQNYDDFDSSTDRLRKLIDLVKVITDTQL